MLAQSCKHGALIRRASLLVRRAIELGSGIFAIGQHPGTRLVLIELTHEADNGANRLWVRVEQLLPASFVA